MATTSAKSSGDTMTISDLVPPTAPVNDGSTPEVFVRFDEIDPRPVLIIDDHHILAQGLCYALRAENVDALVASPESLCDIVATVVAADPSLVVLDLDLGDWHPSGVDLLPRISAMGARVVMLTGVTDRIRLAACLEAGACGVISKSERFTAVLDGVLRARAGEPLLTWHERQEMLMELWAHRESERERLRPFSLLSPREQDVLARLVRGQSAEEIAEASYVSMATVRSQIHSVLTKLGVRSQLAAVAIAREAHWPEEPAD
jgi:DNA-binding NarL/FixJ family response regulator